MTDDRLQELERRVAALEAMVRQLAPHPVGGAAPATSTPVAAAVAATAAAELSARERAARERAAPRIPHEAVAPRGIDLEQWIGQRGLLALGVAALILAAGYLLKLSFERGWISPFVRCVGGSVAGLAVGAIGWRLEGRGLRTYGAALVGSGAAVVYLCVWAATRLYGFLPPTGGVVLLALVSLSLAAIAYAVDTEALGAAAALGASLAPLTVGYEVGNADLLLLYVGCMAAAIGGVAARKRWRLASFVVALAYFGLGLVAAERAGATGTLGYALLGGGCGIYLGLRNGWWETRLLAFVGGWSLLHAAQDRIDAPWLVVLGALALAAPVWWHAWRAPAFWPVRPAATGHPRPARGESLYFLLTPLLVADAVHGVAPAAFTRERGLVALLVGLPYVAAGYRRYRPEFAAVGSTALALAALLQWQGLPATWALLALALVWPALDHGLDRTDGRWYGLAAFALALARLVGDDLPARADSDRAFVDPAALTLWSAVAVAALLAGRLWRVTPAEPVGRPRDRIGAPTVLWCSAALLLLVGVTAELRRFFRQSDLPGPTQHLASGLSASAWWLLFAGGLVALGFRREVKLLRQAGILVAAVAALKVLLVDLSDLDALYRIGSVFTLALVSLLMAYLYHRRARLER